MKNVRLGDVAERINIKVDQATTDLEYYVGGEHIESSEFMLHQKAKIKGSTIGYQFQFGFRDRDILFMTKNPHLRKCTMANFEGLCSIATFVIHTKSEELLQDYLLFEMQSDRFWQYCEDHKSGGVNYFINWGTLSDYEFDLPSLDEQNVLVDKLWAAYRVKESYRKLLLTIDDMVNAKFDYLFGNNKWEQIRLGDLGSFQRGGGFQKADYVESGIPCIHYGQIHTTFGPFTYSHLKEISFELKSKTKFASKGDLVIAITSEDELGSCKCTAWLGDYPVAVGGHAAIFHHNMDPIFTAYVFKSRAFNHEKVKYTRGSKVVEIKPDDIAKILVPAPPMNLQKEFSSIAVQAEATKENLRQSIGNIDHVISSLINQ